MSSLLLDVPTPPGPSLTVCRDTRVVPTTRLTVLSGDVMNMGEARRPGRSTDHQHDEHLDGALDRTPSRRSHSAAARRPDSHSRRLGRGLHGRTANRPKPAHQRPSASAHSPVPWPHRPSADSR